MDLTTPAASRPEPNFAGYHVRKWFTWAEETLATETGALADGDPVRKVVIAAAIHNPYAGRFSDDLSEIVDGSDRLGQEFGRRVIAATGGQRIESYGKACLVGVNGEYEHGNAFLTQAFADPLRQAVGGGQAPAPDEVVAIFAVATRGRVHARLGGLAATAVEGRDGLR